MENYISVSQINTYIKNIFEAEVMLQNIYVYGEVSSYKISNGIAYFNIQDENGLLPCVLFNALKFDAPQVGDMVLLRGSISYYVKGGKLSFNAYSIEPYGKGLLYEKFIELKNQLEALGYFDTSRKKPLPERVGRIGVVTSSTGAVIQDIIDVTTRRNNTIDIVLYPVKVQGVGAEYEIAKGINYFSNYPQVDVVIVARGGGSMEDLEPFNTEVVATATFECNKPIVSAVGHETDFTIIDYVADLRAPTPSAAAELVAWDKSLEIEKINKIIFSIDKIISNKALILKKDIDFSTQKLDNLSTNMLNKLFNDINKKVDNLNKFMDTIDNKINLIDKIQLVVNSLNPIKLSYMGYSKAFQNKVVISKIKDIDKSKSINLSFIDGDIDCRVE